MLYYLHGTADLVIVSGLHIGGQKQTLEIGGVDNPVIRHPISLFPYIPGSSLKGKLRSLLEAIDGKGIDGNPCGCGRAGCRVCTYFGPHKNTKHSLNPTRFLFRDAMLTDETRDYFNSFMDTEKSGYTEVKAENSVDRRIGISKQTDGGYRMIERVPAGSRFQFEMDIRVYQGDDAKQMEQTVRHLMEVLHHDTLGGSGSRGSGHVRFENIQFQRIEVQPRQ
ncbi:type III-A CRISPR-associated RAMP protein Csm3 [Sulfoacidibacillus thermotolerans]|uniref:CRISPR system Cms endoribonuclease Csm3 n=1 Tax=Sulfoacidibacillus thermotolerans TaxID=1765684 RepID=A0A2U3D8J3_SULT2|nr:type III-A CRISPR-associated RAMP protein Csm3 [Sulfoacidibacillus thermotolerans]